jgi:hypothetical protein
VASYLCLHLLDSAAMRPSKLTLSGVSHYAGLVTGATMWAISTQLGQILPYADCAKHFHTSAWVAFGALVLTGLAGLWSWRSIQSGVFENAGPSSTERFIASLSGLASFLFAFALALQGAASLVLSGCER